MPLNWNILFKITVENMHLNLLMCFGVTVRDNITVIRDMAHAIYCFKLRRRHDTYLPTYIVFTHIYFLKKFFRFDAAVTTRSEPISVLPE